MKLTLLQIKNDEQVTIASIDAGREMEKKLSRLGIQAGVRLRKVSGFGPVVVAVGNTQVALGRRMAAHIVVNVEHHKVLLFGNPNVGKSVVFSRLTGSQVISANYAGTSVEYTRGNFNTEGRNLELIDVPGAYTLEATCTAEEIARAFCEKKEADLIVNVVDATNLERNLYLTLQLLEKGIPMILALNKWDVARRKGIQINVEELSRRLRIPVIPVIAVTGWGLKDLTKQIGQTLKAQSPAPEFAPIDHQERWHIIGHISQEVQKIVHRHPSLLERLEDASIRPISGGLMALAVMTLAFLLIRLLGEGLIRHVFDPFFRTIYGPLARQLAGMIPSALIRRILVGRTPEFMQSFGALTTGVYIPIAVVLPYIFSFYLVLGFLEDFGYLPRLAVLLDRVMHRLGLHGYAAIPLILGCGCKVPGVLGLRILETPREKFLALALLLMAAPCLPQSAMIISLISPFGVRYVLLVFAILIFVALINSLILKRIVKGESLESVMEIPSYQMPNLAVQMRKLWLRIRIFLLDAAPVIVLGVLVINILEILGVIDFIGRIARPLVTNVLGLPEGAIAVVLLGFLRKDISIAMLSPLHLNAAQAVTASVFLVLYLPCIATFFVAWREAGGKAVAKLVAVTLLWATLVGWLLKIVL